MVNRNHEAMRKAICKSLFIALLLLSSSGLFAQSVDDSATDSRKNQVFGRVKNFSFSFYVDAYFSFMLDNSGDTSLIIPFSGNCPMYNQIRLNVTALEIYYNAENVRGKLAIQYGDAPNLLTAPNYQWTKNIRQANFGFRIVKDLWVDFGYIFNPVGYESSWSVLNQISSVTVGGYFEPGSVLGAKLSYKFSDKFSAGILFGDPFSIAYAENTNTAGIAFFSYKPTKNLLINLNIFAGDQATRNSEMKNFLVYNNLITVYNPFKKLELVGQLDLGGQTNSGKPPDSTTIATMFSGFLQATYRLDNHFALSGRYEFFNDPDGFLSGINKSTNRGVRTEGLSFCFEYKPVTFGYFRVIYRFLDSYPGSKEFYSHTSDQMQAFLFSTGVRF
jgi:hypothetical protein